MLRDGRFEQHIIIEDFFKKKGIEALQVTFEIKIGGNRQHIHTYSLFRKGNKEGQTISNEFH